MFDIAFGIVWNNVYIFVHSKPKTSIFGSTPQNGSISISPNKSTVYQRITIRPKPSPLTNGYSTPSALKKLSSIYDPKTTLFKDITTSKSPSKCKYYSQMKWIIVGYFRKSLMYLVRFFFSFFILIGEQISWLNEEHFSFCTADMSS